MHPAQHSCGAASGLCSRTLRVETNASPPHPFPRCRASGHAALLRVRACALSSGSMGSRKHDIRFLLNGADGPPSPPTPAPRPAVARRLSALGAGTLPSPAGAVRPGSRKKLADPRAVFFDPDAAKRKYVCHVPGCGCRFKQRGGTCEMLLFWRSEPISSRTLTDGRGRLEEAHPGGAQQRAQLRLPCLLEGIWGKRVRLVPQFLLRYLYYFWVAVANKDCLHAFLLWFIRLFFFAFLPPVLFLSSSVTFISSLLELPVSFLFLWPSIRVSACSRHCRLLLRSIQSTFSSPTSSLRQEGLQRCVATMHDLDF